MKQYILFVVLFALLIGTGLAENTKTFDVKSFQTALEKDGFTVQKGELGSWDWLKLYDLGLLPSAYGGNPATKYLTYFVPPAPGHKVSEQLIKMARAFGVTLNVSPYWNLGPDEAVVFVGRTPPECRYFSFDHYLLARTYGNETRWILANLGDTLNNLVINTEGTPNGLAGSPFNQTAIVVTTADRGIDQRIRAAAISAGYSNDLFNTQVLPSAMLNMGLENDSDTFAVYIRPTLFQDQQSGNDYINKPPATIFRITPNESTNLDQYNYPDLRVRGTGKTEFDLIDDLEELRDAILNKYSNLNATELPTSIPIMGGSDAIQRGINADIPDNDACYLWSINQSVSQQTPPFFDVYKTWPFLRDPAITLGNDSNEFIIVYGVNHVATGKATYENFAPYASNSIKGSGMIGDSDFNGTAQAYLPDNPNAKYLYVYKIARHANGDPHCFELPYGPGAFGIGADEPLFIFWRAYLEKATKTGPSFSEIVYDRAIKFDPKE
jgi:hypothetical protein